MADWIIFFYTLPKKKNNTLRMNLWRRFPRLGAITLGRGVYLVPFNEECLGIFQQMKGDIEKAQGKAFIAHVQKIEGLTKAQLITQFNEARLVEYEEIETKLSRLEQELDSGIIELKTARHSLSMLQRRYQNVAHVDYFDCPKKKVLLEQLRDLAHKVMLRAIVSP